MTPTSAIKSSMSAIAAQTAGSGPPLGYLVWWRLLGRHSQADLVSAFAARGLDAKLVPAALDTERAFRRAVRRVVKSPGSSKLIRPVADDNEIVLGVVSETADVANRDLEYQVVDRIALDKGSKAITGGGAAAVQAEVSSLEEMVEGSDLTRHLVRWIDSEGGCALRDDGGVYWVPASAGPTLYKIGDAIEEATNKGCALYPLPIGASAEAERGLGDSAKAGLESQIADVAAEIEKFKEESPQRYTLERRLTKFEDLRKRAAMYRDLLKVSAGDLEEKIGTLEADVLALLTAKDKEADEKAEKIAKEKADRAAEAAQAKAKPRKRVLTEGDDVTLTAAAAPNYDGAGISQETVLSVVGPGPMTGTLWVQPESGPKMIVATSDVA